MSETGSLTINQMEKFIKHSGKCVPLYEANIDTDQIVPKKFLLSTERAGFSKALFYDWRYDNEGGLNESFVLNNPRFQRATILLSGANFGCGSSREHAPWALFEYGFKVIIAPSFADIFYNNCFKIGLLPIILPEKLIIDLVNNANNNPEFKLVVDLRNKTISDGKGVNIEFNIDDFRRQSLLNGFDDIDLTLMRQNRIENFEKNMINFIEK